MKMLRLIEIEENGLTVAAAYDTIFNRVVKLKTENGMFVPSEGDHPWWFVHDHTDQITGWYASLSAAQEAAKGEGLELALDGPLKLGTLGISPGKKMQPGRVWEVIDCRPAISAPYRDYRVYAD